MPNVPNLVERLLLRTNQYPGVLLDLLGAVVFRAVFAALNLGVFEALAAGSLTTAELAQRLGCSERGLDELLRVLASADYLSAHDGRYAATSMTERWLQRRSPQAVVDFMTLWGATVFDLWDDLEASVRKGAPAVHMHDWLSQRRDGWPLFNAAMRAAAVQGAEEVAQRVPLPATARTLLDVGGSHGLYSAALCKRHGALSATVFDAPEALAAARQTIAAEGLGERMQTRVGDMTKDDFGTGWDAVLLFNVLHYFDAAQNAKLLAKTASALAPGGALVIMDQLADVAPLPTARTFVRVLSLQYFNTLDSRVYRSDEIGGWLRGAGFGAPRRISLRKLPGVYLMVATRR